MDKKVDFISGQILCQRFRVEKKIGEGSFGAIFLALDLLKNFHVALKVESILSNSQQALIKEAKVLQDLETQPYFPKMYYIAKDLQCHILAMTLFGRNLQMLHKICDNKFSIQTTAKVASEIISRLQSLHSIGYLHRDIKPENMVECLDSNEIYLIDFGLSKKFSDGVTHIPPLKNIGMVGTVRYASLNTQFGKEQSRRDDLISLGYVLVYFLTGSLPWMNIPAANRKEKHQKIKDVKMQYQLIELVQDLPEFMKQYMRYVGDLEFYAQPDYSYLKSLFANVFNTKRFLYDWKKYEISNQYNKSTQDDKFEETSLIFDSEHLSFDQNITQIISHNIEINASKKLFGLDFLSEDFDEFTNKDNLKFKINKYNQLKSEFELNDGFYQIFISFIITLIQFSVSTLQIQKKQVQKE